ncbi:MAG TPA: HepT-like ribonuclease domain-containing protein [Stellaceae bacterium]|nr:HepT-like ribonuclease domain-containing protein [Stellaceae bacterium]
MTWCPPLRRQTRRFEAIERVRAGMAGVTIEAFEADWRKRWLVERGVEIISEASRRLADELKTRHPEIPWTKVAGIGNVLRHEYEDLAPPVMWKLVQDDFMHLTEPDRSRRERCGIKTKREDA